MEKKSNAASEFIRAHKKAVSIAAAVLVLIAAVVTAANATLPKADKIVYGVVIDAVELGGMTVEEAQTALSGSDFYAGKTFVLVSGDERETVLGEDIALTADIEQSVQAAYEIGRGDSWFKNVATTVKLRFSKLAVNPVPTVDEEKLDSILFNMGVRKNGEMKNAQATVLSETEVKVTPPSAGQSSDVSKERGEVLAALAAGDAEEIEVTLPISDPGKLTAEQVYAVVYRQASDAAYTLNGKELLITEEVVGMEADKTEISGKLSSLNSGNAITLTVKKLVPEVTAASLKSGLFSAELASYSSTYSTAAANRAFNVSRAASSVNGTILLPGDTFSYNSAIGNPSLANGYKMASVYENGKQTEGVGGGVCQVSSTLYSAALYANLEIVERRSHSLTVSYVPKGQDATVSYGSLDFKFRNNTKHPIKIEASAVKGKCVIRILGTAPEVAQQVSITHTVAAVNEPTVTETKDPTLPEGTRKVTSSGKTGYVVDSVRTVSENGAVVKTEKLTRSTYKMVPTEVTVGTMPPPTPSPAPTAPASSPVTAPEATTTPSVQHTSEPTAIPESDESAQTEPAA